MTYHAAQIYKITNTETNRIYIGATSHGIHKRLLGHMYDLKAERHPSALMQVDYGKHGKESFVVELIEDVERWQDIKERENYWISQFFDNHVNCYNNSIKDKFNGHWRKSS